MSDPVCPCDIRLFPPKLDIPAGLSSLPRQLGGFPEFRAALLAGLTEAAQVHPSLAGWRARDTDDFGLLLLEMWAYVCDVVAFYDQLHANEAYLRTAVLPASLRRLVGLIGYLPRPELASSASVGVLVDGRVPVLLPSRTEFRSTAFGTEPPQVFETSADTTVNPDANQWNVIPPRATTLRGTVDFLLLDPATARVQRDNLLWLELGGRSYTATWIGRASQVSTVTLADGGRYTRVDLVSPLVLDQTRAIAQMRLLTPTQRTGLWTPRDETRLVPINITKSARILSSSTIGIGPIVFGSDDPPLEDDWGNASGPHGTRLLLNSLNRSIAIGDRLLLEVPGDTQGVRGAKLNKPLVTVVPSQTIKVGTTSVTTPATRVPTTRLYADAWIPDPDDTAAVGNSDWSDPGKLVIHYGLVDAGTVMASAATVLAPGDPIGLSGLHVPPFGPPLVKEVLLSSADQRGVESAAGVDFTAGKLTLDSTTTWQPPLELPVQVYGNVLHVTRGETVAAEVLGSGDATQRYQSFVLQKKPLTYVPSSSTQSDWAAVSTLHILVDGLEWTEVPTLYGINSSDQVYIVRRRDDGSSVVTFGSPLPTGAGNVIASYRFGGGAAAPPAFAIKQIARPVAGLKSVVNPVAAAGGADAEGPETVRSAAPKSALLLGRAVSIDDFAAAAAAVGSVRFASAEWRWSKLRHRPVVQVWYVGATELKRLISQRLRGMADPSTPIDVTEAEGLPAVLTVDVQTDPRRDTPTVLGAVRDALLAPGKGLLEPERQGIGTTLFRSTIMQTVLTVPGAVAVRALTLNGVSFSPYGRNPGPGKFFDFEAALSVTGSASNV